MTDLRVVAIVQARMGSERLPGKVLRHLDGHPVLWHVVERLGRCRTLHEVVVATSDSAVDDALAAYCEAQGVRVVRGSEHDVMSRYRVAIEATSADVAVRITADCPLIDPDVVDLVVDTLLADAVGLDYVSNTVERSYPRGMDVEAFLAEAFLRADGRSPDLAWREHVTPAFYRLPAEFRSRQVSRPDPLDTASWRLTLDTVQDYEALSALAAFFVGRFTEVGLSELEDVLKAHPEIRALNNTVAQKVVG